jgi:hypothetical protein
MKLVSKLTAEHWFLTIYLILSLLIRFWNFDDAMYFIYDVGRDAIVLREMAGGDIKLIGATTGLPGLFLGPLWYYAGLPGYFLSSGNPYGIQLWYIALASLALPLYWLVSKRLFGAGFFAALAAILLSITPGGMTGTNFVWNVMLSLPLVTGALWFLAKSREHSTNVYWGFFFLALTLQSEFAYAVFFVTTLWFLIPYLRGKFEWKTMLVTLGVIGITLIPQGLFELKTGFSMTKSLFAGMNQTGTTVPQSYLWQHRPQQLWNATRPFFVRGDFYPEIVVGGLVFFWLVAALFILLKGDFPWKLVLLLALLPYGFYMFWGGNYGFFFDYYITPHFIFLTLLVVYGMQQLVLLFRPFIVVPLCFVALLLIHSYVHLSGVILFPQNNAGLKVMEQSIARLFEWSKSDNTNQAVFRIYTRNLATENYDYLIWWYAKEHSLPHPLTVVSATDTYRYILFEPDEHTFAERFMPWYTTATFGMEKVRGETHGILGLETYHAKE